MRRLVLILIIALFAVPVFSQKGEVKSGTIKVVKKKYKVRKIYPVDLSNGFISNGRGQKLVVANLYGQYGFYPLSGEELLAQGKIYVNSSEFKVISFDVSGRVSGIEVVESSTGNQFSDNQKKLAVYLRNGMPLFIENIKCKNEEGVIRDVGSIIIKITGPNSMMGRGVVLHDPFLIASVSGIYGLGVLRIKKADLLNAKKIDLADSSSKIVGFNLFCDCGGTKWTEHSASDQFTPKMMDILSKVRKGCEVQFQMIRYSTDGGTPINYGNLLFTIVK